MSESRYLVAQPGARQHYAVPRALHDCGALRLFYTDAWCRRGQRWLSRGPAVLRSLAQRRHDALPSDKVVSFNWRTMWDESYHRVFESEADMAALYGWFERMGRRFAQRVARHLVRQKLDPDMDVFFGFNVASLEALEHLAERGVVTIVDQVDPARVEEDLVLSDAERWPGWARLPGRIDDAYYQRLATEWHAASLVLVNSAWSRDALVQQGVPTGKIIVVAQAYEGPIAAEPRRPSPDRPLHVVWIGRVMLRKGIQYLIQAANRLTDSNVRFTIAGPIEISSQALATAPPSMTFLGRITRDQASDVYRDADVFVLPTLSDGFAITQLEAMAHGVPVIATPNCGQVVTDGKDGWIVPIRNADALAEAVARCDQDRERTAQMSEAAIAKSRQFTLARYAQTVNEAVAAWRQRGGQPQSGDAASKPINAGPPRPI